MLGETEKSLDVCRTASLSEMGHGQRAATSSTVTDQRQKNFFVRKLSFEIEVPPNRRVLRNGDDFMVEGSGLLPCKHGFNSCWQPYNNNNNKVTYKQCSLKKTQTRSRHMSFGAAEQVCLQVSCKSCRMEE